MLVINRLTKSGGIKRVIIRLETVVVRTIDGEEIIYRRTKDEEPLSEGVFALRRDVLVR